MMDHAITIRDILIASAAMLTLIAIVGAWAIWWSHPLLIERRRLRCLRNPAYGIPKRWWR